MRATFSYNSRDRLLTSDLKNGATSFLDLDYTHDNNGNITQLVNGWRDTDSDWNSDTESYGYDGLDRLTSGSCNAWSHTYSYDKVGNRTAMNSVTYTINTVNEVTALSDNTSFSYDNNGNRTQKTKGTDTWVYTYDYANRLTGVEKNSSTIGEYVYNGDSRRIRVTEDGVTKTSIYSGTSPVYEETSSGHADYIYGPTGRIAKRATMSSESDTYFYHNDHLGSTRLVTDADKTVVVAATYEPFGESSVKEGEDVYLFNGKERDTTGLYYYGARYYDPETGKFMTRDPLKGELMNPQSLNRYTYCLNNPVDLVDPWGLMEDRFSMEGGGTQEEPEVTGDPSYDGNGEITIPTSEGDVTIDLDSEEDWGDAADKAEEKAQEKEIERIKGMIKERERQYDERNPWFSVGVEVTAGFVEGMGFGFGFGAVLDSNGDFHVYGIQQIGIAGLELGSGDVSVFVSAWSADEVSSGTALCAEGNCGPAVGVNAQLSGPWGTPSLPEKFNLGVSYSPVPLPAGGAAWFSETFQLY